MTPRIEVTEADRVPRHARVAHYDELTGEAKHALPDAVERGHTDVPWTAAAQFASIDVVKFTAYYRVTVADLRRPTDRTAAGTTTPTRDDRRDRDHPASGPLLD